MIREVKAVVRREHSSLLMLSCGHDRSIGGHVMPDGRPVADFAKNGIGYDCRDGHCWRSA